MHRYYLNMLKEFLKVGFEQCPENTPLTCKIFENHEHPITKFILYLHTLETFLFKDLKTASREKDESKIMTLGPYALILSYILSSADYSN